MLYKFKKIYLVLIIMILIIFNICPITNGINNVDVSLKELQLDREGLVPKFEENIYEYYLTIPNHINNIQIKAIPQNQNAGVEILGNDNLKDGLNDIQIRVTGDNNLYTTYTIHVTKTNDLELANTRLENLAIQEILLNPPFDPDMTQYQVDIPYDIEKLNILAIPENENSKVAIEGNDQLQEGKNIINIEVMAQNNITKRTYVIIANRRNQEQELLYQQQEKLKRQTQVQQIQKAYKAERTNANITQKSQKEKFNWGIVSFFIVIVIAVIIKLFSKKGFNE